MDETFYAALGVDEDADAAAIRAAYRERVKERHPDVSEDPGAPGEFKRLTTARDVLVDETERERYDRLGHAVYVRRNLQGGVWGTDAAPSGTDGAGQTPGGGEHAATESNQRVRRSGGSGGSEDRRTWLGEDWSRSSTPGGGEATGTRGSAATGTGGGAATQSWQTASDTYRYSPSGVPTERQSVGGRVAGLVRSIGPWLLVHAVFLVAATGVAWLLYLRVQATTQLTLPAMAVSLLLVGLALFLSAMHVVSLSSV